jgi:hypothetical protein
VARSTRPADFFADLDGGAWMRDTDPDTRPMTPFDLDESGTREAQHKLRNTATPSPAAYAATVPVPCDALALKTAITKRQRQPRPRHPEPGAGLSVPPRQRDRAAAKHH